MVNEQKAKDFEDELKRSKMVNEALNARKDNKIK